ncbi:hypothetical protein FYL99_RS20205 [Escherichia coli]|nr:hypothetical protein [Escherichia coli]
MMFQHSLPQKIDVFCHSVRVFTATCDYALSTTIRDASRELARLVSHDYRHNPPAQCYRVFSASGLGCWIIGVSAETSYTLQSRFSALYHSQRLIDRQHCTDNIALIIEYELNKMPVINITGIIRQK